MALPGWLTLNVFVMLIDAMLLIFVEHKRVRTLQDKTFARLLAVVLALLVMDSFSRVTADFAPGFPLPLAHFGTLFIFVCDPVGYLFALSYIDSWVSPTRGGSRMRTVLFFACGSYVVLNALLVIASQALGLGWVYSFMPDGTYVRGPLYIPRGICNMLFCLVVGLYAAVRRQDIRERYRHLILAFPLIVLISGLMQIAIGGVGFEYAGTVFACLLLFVYVQDHNMDVDYLTGLLNRRGIDHELTIRTTRGNKRRAFAACMIDLDHFKRINDEYGHDAGDQALRLMAALLTRAFGTGYRIGRYGGDEFFIVSASARPALADAASLSDDIGKRIDTLHRLCTEANDTGKHPFHLSFSAGYATFDPSANENASLDAFTSYIDELMYHEKAVHHAQTAFPDE